MTMQAKGPGKLIKRTVSQGSAPDEYEFRYENPSPPPPYLTIMVRADATDDRIDKVLRERFDASDETVEITYDDAGSGPYSLASVSYKK